MIHTVKGFSIVNEADVFLECSCFFYDLADVGNLICGSSAFSKSSLNIWEFSVQVLLKLGLENFEHYWTQNIILASKKGGRSGGTGFLDESPAGSDVLLLLGTS